MCIRDSSEGVSGAGDGSSSMGRPTADGVLVVMTSNATNFDSLDTNSSMDVFLVLPGDGPGDPQSFCDSVDSIGCPCGNAGAAGEGCANGSGAGAILSASGDASASGSSFVLSAVQLIPSQPGLYFQGNNAINGGAGVAFGDGLRCAGGGVIRLQVRFADGTGSSATSIDIAAKGGVAPGDLKRYQIWYRDPNSSLCGAGFNLSNGMELTWSA